MQRDEVQPIWQTTLLLEKAGSNGSNIGALLEHQKNSVLPLPPADWADILLASQAWKNSRIQSISREKKMLEFATAVNSVMES
jgi:hypothetical protein